MNLACPISSEEVQKLQLMAEEEGGDAPLQVRARCGDAVSPREGLDFIFSMVGSRSSNLQQVCCGGAMKQGDYLHSCWPVSSPRGS